MLKPSFLLFIGFAFFPLFTMAENGLLMINSQYAVEETADRLERTVAAKGFTVFARVDHAAGAQNVGKTLPPSQLLIFGKPEAGTALMQSAMTAGIDLPMKFLVWQGSDGEVFVGWNDVYWLAERHGIDPSMPVLDKMSGAMRVLADAAAN